MTNYLVQDSTGPQVTQIEKVLNQYKCNPQLPVPEHPFRRSLVPAEVRLTPGPGPHFVSKFS